MSVFLDNLKCGSLSFGTYTLQFCEAIPVGSIFRRLAILLHRIAYSRNATRNADRTNKKGLYLFWQQLADLPKGILYSAKIPFSFAASRCL
jgi:hypothetical protein